MFLTAVLALVGFGGPAYGQDVDGPETSSDAPVQIMVLGSYHFANPGQDEVNLNAPDMLVDTRQRELQILAEALAEWRPTRIAVESQASAPDFALPTFANAETLLRQQRNESIQIGYRLALMLGHEEVYGFDERADDDEPDYFPFGALQEFAQANGQMPVIENALGQTQAMISAQEEVLPDISVAASLIPHNDPAVIEDGHDAVYYSFLLIGDGDAQPGAELNAYWYMRNAKMFAKLAEIAQPGDRVLAIVGSGHARWLRHFARTVPGFELVEAMPYLRAADIASEMDAQ
ncbi:DUF5694 domain-containing protein [Aurantiacibacter sp. MUD61]|uniref:DUF5694 domain-containing protein n=1 Tax=Aurantiacibacter sp. MUD61 TaxID=3009083 RepID=UPI0022F01B94|nr:DUF5694 domain-containing protein [Aurantiacibacter sp. MUD61]